MRKPLLISIIALSAFGLGAIPISDALAAPCKRGLKSQNSKSPVTVTFVNRSGEYRGVMWMDFKGMPVTYTNLNPGQSYTINTYLTHPWMFTDGPGNCVEMFMPSKGVKKFNITKKSTGVGGD